MGNRRCPRYPAGPARCTAVGTLRRDADPGPSAHVVTGSHLPLFVAHAGLLHPVPVAGMPSGHPPHALEPGALRTRPGDRTAIVDGTLPLMSVHACVPV